MILDVKQLSKELFAASFVIKRGLAEVGKISVQGRFGSMEATINGVFKGQYFEMDYIKNPIFKNRYDFRKYVISDNGYENGTVCQTEKKVGLFKGYSYRQMVYCGEIYEMFSLGMGKEGFKSPVYNKNRQIAQIDKDCMVYNQLHNYRIFAEDENSAKIAVMFCAYFYISGAYSPGEKVTSSKVKTVSVTTNKLLKEKYNPEFTADIVE